MARAKMSKDEQGRTDFLPGKTIAATAENSRPDQKAVNKLCILRRCGISPKENCMAKRFLTSATGS
jgi:hypothetical protein